MDRILPHKNNYFTAHEEAESMFLNAWKAGTLHNSWLISGPEGIGKATFAYRIARFLLSADESKRDNYNSLNVFEDNPTFRLVANNSHPDLKIIERSFIEADKKKIIKAIKDGDALDEEQLQGLKRSSVIKVDEVREINTFLSKKSFDGNWRIVIVDSVDDLNTAGANAILKILEEPPAKSLLLLISHNPNSLLPTIRSRCAKINLQPLPDNTVASLLRRYCSELSETEVNGLSKISNGSIGRAINYAENNGLQLYQNLESLFCTRTSFDLETAVSLAEKAAQNENNWDLICGLILRFLSEAIRGGEKIREIGEVWDKTQRLFREADSLNMDKKQILINVISMVGKAV